MMGTALRTVANDRTHWGSSDSQGTQWVSQYDHATGVLTRTQVYQSNQPEIHRCPTMLRRASDGRLVVFYSHGTDLRDIAVRISTNPEDSTSWGAQALVGHGLGNYYSSYYLQPFQLLSEANTPIYLFFKAFVAGTDYDLYYVKSTDDVATWGAPVKVVDGNGQRPYAVWKDNGNARADVLLSRGHSAEVSAGTGGIYHAYYTGGSYYKSDGTLIGATAFNVDAATVIYDGALGPGWLIDLVTPGGVPIALYSYSPDHDTVVYVYAKWNGLAWVKTVLATSLPISAAVWFTAGTGALDPVNASLVYLSVKAPGGELEMYTYVTADGGATFAPTAMTSGSALANSQPRVPRNASADLQVLWMAGSVESYLTFIIRDKSYPAHW